MSRHWRPDHKCGIMYHYQHTPVYLPLEHASATVSIVDVSAIVTIKQVFWQYSTSVSDRARYVFPVPSKAAVCGFEMRREDGTVIKAIAKEKEQARKEHEAAIQQGRMTGLVEHITDDAFCVSLGALPASQLLTTTLTYVLDLMDADLSDQVRFQLPACVGMRYGEPPAGMVGAYQGINRISVTTNIRMKGPIRSIASPTHSITTTSDGLMKQWTKYSSDEFLQQDFVLIIKADGLDEPRAFAEHHPSGTIAMQLTLVPKFYLPQITTQEYVFIVDRSGSMGGSRIETAKKTLIMLLRALPSRGTMFNIFSFGNHCDSLFPESSPYTQGSLARATAAIDTMTANYGGTEIRSALTTVFSCRQQHTPTACFLLTDGEAYDIDGTLQVVSESVKRARSDAPLRVFTLGIGETTSTAMCEGIARSGNGMCLMATTSESIVGKCSKLVKASRTSYLTNITVDWGADFTASSDVTAQTEMLRQAPAKITTLYPGGRSVIFALLKHRDFVVPRQVVIRAQPYGESEPITLSVPVEDVSYVTEDSEKQLIHTLAARRVIQDMDDADRGTNAPTVKSAIIHLGEQYQLASRYTSFIAVDDETIVEPDPPPEKSFGSYLSHGVPRFGARLGGLRGGNIGMMGAAQPVPMSGTSHVQDRQGPFHGVPPALAQVQSRQTSLFGGGPQQQVQQAQQAQQTAFFSAAPPSPSAMFEIGGYVPAPAPLALLGWQPMAYKAPSPVPPPQQVLMASPAQPPPPPPPPGAFAPALARLASEMNREMHAANGRVVSDRDRDRKPIPTEAEKVLLLVRLQSYDGSWPPYGNGLEVIMGKAALDEGAKLGVDKTVWATVLAIAFLQEHMKDEPELLEGLLEKATDFLSASPGVNMDELLGIAKLVL